MLNDPSALANMLRQQYESVQNKNSQLRQQEAQSIESNQYTSIQTTGEPQTQSSIMLTAQEAKKPFEIDPDESEAPTQYEIDLDNPSIL